MVEKGSGCTRDETMAIKAGGRNNHPVKLSNSVQTMESLPT